MLDIYLLDPPAYRHASVADIMYWFDRAGEAPDAALRIAERDGVSSWFSTARS